MTDEVITKMSQSLPVLDRVTRRCDVKKIAPYVFQITLTQGLNRQIRRMCEYFGYEVTKLERVRIMDIHLGNLKQGNWRNLTEAEMNRLFDKIDSSENDAKPKKPSKPKHLYKPKDKEGTRGKESRDDNKTGRPSKKDGSGGFKRSDLRGGEGTSQVDGSKGGTRGGARKSSAPSKSSKSARSAAPVTRGSVKRRK